MAYTVLNLITRAMRLLSVLEIAEPPTADEEETGLEAVNAMVDAWAIERLMIYTTARLEFALNGGQPSYEIGPNADPELGWVAARPAFIEGAGLIYSAGTTTPVELPIRILTLKEWRNKRIKGLLSGGQIVSELYYDRAFTNADGSNTGLDGAADTGSGNVFVLPIPTGGAAIALYLPQSVSEFASINQTIALPPGYRRALAYNLAVEVAPEFEAEPSDVVVAIALESKANLKRANLHVDLLSCDPGMTGGGRRGGAWNIYDGEGR